MGGGGWCGGGLRTGSDERQEHSAAKPEKGIILPSCFAFQSTYVTECQYPQEPTSSEPS